MARLHRPGSFARPRPPPARVRPESLFSVQEVATDIPKALLEAVAARPDDDAPRLVYADLLEEHGDPRGELVQVQCALARLPHGDPNAAALRARERSLLREHGAQWLADLGLADGEGTFRRGFLEELAVSPARLGDVGESLRRAGVLARRLRLRLAPDELVQDRALYLDAPILDRLEVLEVDLRLDDAAIGSVLESPAVRRVRALSLRGVAASGALVPVLADADLSAEQIDLSFNSFGPAAGAHLARARWLPRVRRLVLARTGLGDEGTAALGRARTAGRLHHLDLCSNDIERAASLGGVLSFPSLAALDLAANQLHFQSAPPATVTPALSRLNLSLNGIDDSGAATLARWEGIDTLASLELWSNPIGSEGATLLHQRFGARVLLGEP